MAEFPAAPGGGRERGDKKRAGPCACAQPRPALTVLRFTGGVHAVNIHVGGHSLVRTYDSV